MIIDFVSWFQFRLCILHRYAQYFKIFEIRIAIDNSMGKNWYYELGFLKFNFVSKYHMER